MLCLVKALILSALMALACFTFQQSSHAQYKGARSYFPKGPPAPPPNGAPSSSAINAPSKQHPKPPQSKFKDVPVNTGFYFLADTNRTYPWTKTSTSQARNTRNGVVQTINVETPVQR